MSKSPRGSSSRDGTRANKPSRKTAHGQTAAAKGARRPRASNAGARQPRTASGVANAAAPGDQMRIAKAMARAGLCSRREAERWIADGRVKVNGETIASPARDVGPDDRVLVDGRPLPAPEPTRLWRYAKPRGVVTTHRDPEGRPTVFDALPDDMPRVLSIGRLDFNSEGLLLLTTDGELARHLELPSTGWLRRYRVRAHGRISQGDLDALADGVTVDGVHYGAIEATLDSQQGANVWLTIGLREGKNREVRKVLASLGLEVNRLIRISFGPFQLHTMKPGTVEVVRRKVLVEQLGRRLAAQFNLAGGEDAAGPPRQRSAAPSGEAPAGHAQAPKANRKRARASRAAPDDVPLPGADADAFDETAIDDIKPWQVAAEEPPPRPRARRRAKPGRAKTAPRKPERP